MHLSFLPPTKIECLVPVECSQPVPWTEDGAMDLMVLFSLFCDATVPMCFFLFFYPGLLLIVLETISV